MGWMRRFRSGGLAVALLLMLAAAPAWAGSVHDSGVVTGKSSAQQTLLVDDHVTVKITSDTQIVDPNGNRVSFDSIPVAGGPGGQALVEYQGTQSGGEVVADRVVVRLLTE